MVQIVVNCNLSLDSIISKENVMEERNGLGYFLLGLGVGIAAGILWAPRSGEETRALLADRAGEGADYLRSRAQDGTDYVKQRTGEVRQSATDLYEKGKNQVSRHRETLNAAVEAGKQAYRDAMGDTHSAASSVGAGHPGDGV
jgi:gas vesicle protein